MFTRSFQSQSCRLWSPGRAPDKSEKGSPRFPPPKNLGLVLGLLETEASYQWRVGRLSQEGPLHNSAKVPEAMALRSWRRSFPAEATTMSRVGEQGRTDSGVHHEANSRLMFTQETHQHIDKVRKALSRCLCGEISFVQCLLDGALIPFCCILRSPVCPPYSLFGHISKNKQKVGHSGAHSVWSDERDGRGYKA